METFFKKYFWTVQVAFVVAVGLLLAGTVNALIGSFVAPLSVAVPASDGTDEEADFEDGPVFDVPVSGIATNPPAIEAPVDLCADVTCDDEQRCDPASGECVDIEPEIVEAVDPSRCVESDIAINLVGTMVAESPEWSMAVLHNPSTNKTQFAMIGTNLLAEADVTRIERNRIFLTRNGREECLRPGDQATRQQRAAASGTPAARPAPRPTVNRPSVASAREPEPAAAVAPAGGTIEDRVRAGVVRGENGEYQIQRDLIQEVANDRSLLEQQAPRVVPNYVNGQPRGFRLQGIRAGSIFSAIGIRNGDVLVAVNGQDIDSPQRAIQLYESMLSQPQVQMQVLRRGREQTLTYNIQ